MEVTNIIMTIQKLRAAVCAIVNNNEIIINETEAIYNSSR
jgi:hypothetical protein